MKLWILKPVNDNVTVNLNGHDVKLWTWDCSYGFVIRAQTEQIARSQAADEAGDEGSEAWLSPKFTSCEELSAEGEPGVVLKDFLAG